MILVVSYPDEEHTGLVVEHLERAGRDVLRLDLAEFPVHAGVRARWGDGAPSYTIERDGRCVDLAAVDVVWWRRVRAFEIDASITDAQRRAFAFSETSQTVHGILDALDACWMNPRLADEAAHHKPYQWSVAQALGLRLPRTLVTTQAAAAREFIERIGVGKVVFKAFLASIEDWRETRLVEREDVGRLDLLRYAPVIFQEYIEGVDLRITIVGEQIFAAAIDARRSSYPVDMRMVVGEGVVEAVELPPALCERLLALQRRLGLRYGAIDMRRTDAGEYVFLEVNPAGQWLFVEQRTGQPIARAVAEELAMLERRPPRGRKGSPSPAPTPAPSRSGASAA